MSLIIIKKETLKNVAVIILSNKKGVLKEEILEDITIIKSDDEVVGINVFNFKKYFEAKEGAHTINSLQIDAIEKLGFKIEDSKSKFVIGEVIEKEIHPKSNKLFLLKVRTSEDLQIVTNADNANIGSQVVVANVGATLPSGKSINLGKVMGIESQGMLCGGATLGREDTDGVLLVDGNNGDEYIL